MDTAQKYKVSWMYILLRGGGDSGFVFLKSWFLELGFESSVHLFAENEKRLYKRKSYLPRHLGKMWCGICTRCLACYIRESRRWQN